MATTHISEAEAALDFAGLITRVKAGEEIVIEVGARAVVVMKSVEDLSPYPVAAPGTFPTRSLEETIARMQESERTRGYPAVMDEDFAKDMQDIISLRRPADHSHWDD